MKTVASYRLFPGMGVGVLFQGKIGFQQAMDP